MIAPASLMLVILSLILISFVFLYGFNALSMTYKFPPTIQYAIIIIGSIAVLLTYIYIAPDIGSELRQSFFEHGGVSNATLLAKFLIMSIGTAYVYFLQYLVWGRWERARKYRHLQEKKRKDLLNEEGRIGQIVRWIRRGSGD
jgi:hypothetical protein